ncbi:hypothetical protein D3C71_2098290 [compost metagenome]
MGHIMPTALNIDLCPWGRGNGANDVGCLGESVPRLAAGLDDCAIRIEDAMAEAVLA